jgi:hypothetical protein
MMGVAHIDEIDGETIDEQEVEPSLPEQFATLEKKIEQGFQTFEQVGLALMEIRDRKLYLGSGYSSFKDYCREGWGFGASRGRQLIAAAKLTQGLPETVTNGNAPLNERQARKLAREQREPEITEAEFEVIEGAKQSPPEPAEGELVYGIQLTATELRALIVSLESETDACLRGVLELLQQALPQTTLPA